MLQTCARQVLAVGSFTLYARGTYLYNAFSGIVGVRALAFERLVILLVEPPRMDLVGLIEVTARKSLSRPNDHWNPWVMTTDSIPWEHLQFPLIAGHPSKIRVPKLWRNNRGSQRSFHLTLYLLPFRVFFPSPPLLVAFSPCF